MAGAAFPFGRVLLLYGASLVIGFPVIVIATWADGSVSQSSAILLVDFTAIYAAGRLAARRMEQRPVWGDLLWVAALAWGLQLFLNLSVLVGALWFQGSELSWDDLEQVWMAGTGGGSLLRSILGEFTIAVLFNLVGLGLGVRRERRLRWLSEPWSQGPRCRGLTLTKPGLQPYPPACACLRGGLGLRVTVS